MSDPIFYPKLLIIANNSLSNSNSNGRTLGSLLQGWPKDRIAQFCISSDGPNYDICQNYYCVTDKDVLLATLKLSSAKRRTLQDFECINSNRTKDGYQLHFKTPFNMIIRNTIWNLGFWRGREFKEWVKDFNPDILLLQNGESYFMHKLAMQIAEQTNAVLTIFNTQGYYFFNKEWFPAKNSIEKLIFKIYRKIYCRIFRNFMQKSRLSIYGNDLLKNDYNKEFGDNSVVIYTGSTIKFEPKDLVKPPKFSYFGNMGFNRPKALIEFATILKEIDSSYMLDVYGFVKSDSMKKNLEMCDAIKFHGSIPYEEVIKKIEDSDFLIHVESQEKEFCESLRYGFSTKIADSISSGKILILYASPDIACSQYIIKNGAGVFASNREDLKLVIRKLIENPGYKKTVENKAFQISQENHNTFLNSQKMYDAIKLVIESGNK